MRSSILDSIAERLNSRGKASGIAIIFNNTPSNSPGDFRLKAFSDYTNKDDLLIIFVRLYSSQFSIAYSIDRSSIDISVPCSLNAFRLMQLGVRRVFPSIDFIFGGMASLWDNIFYPRQASIFLRSLIKIVPAKTKIVLVPSGPPFGLFGLALDLSREFNLPFILDLRDHWSTVQEIAFPYSFLMRFFRLRERNLLRRSTLFFVTTSHHLKILETISPSSNGLVIPNGFSGPAYPSCPLSPGTKSYDELLEKSCLNVVYAGHFYSSQKLTFLLESLLALAPVIRQSVKLFFLGYSSSLKKALPEIGRLGLSDCFVFLGRMPFKEAMQFMSRCDLGLYISYRDASNCPIPGMPGSKIYRYVGLGLPVLLLPSDDDEAERILSNCGLNFSAATAHESASMLEQLVIEKRASGFIDVDANLQAIPSHHQGLHVSKAANAMAKVLDI